MTRDLLPTRWDILRPEGKLFKDKDYVLFASASSAQNVPGYLAERKPTPASSGPEPLPSTKDCHPVSSSTLLRWKPH